MNLWTNIHRTDGGQTTKIRKKNGKVKGWGKEITKCGYPRLSSQLLKYFSFTSILLTNLDSKNEEIIKVISIQARPSSISKNEFLLIDKLQSSQTKKVNPA